MIIERTLMGELIRWKESTRRKPLILKGVRQCGKTWLLRHFGEERFENTVYFNFERTKELASFFDGAYDPQQILLNLSAYARQRIQAQSTLLIFDEVQTCPRALNSLKYFCEQNPEYAIAAAGSLLGISLTSPEGFPVGKVDFLELTPCTFKEYLQTADPMLADYCGKVSLSPIPEAFAIRLGNYFREYLAFGGMPAVMSVFLDTHDVIETDHELAAVLQSYEPDFSKHIPSRDIPKLFMIWQSIPVQFARENSKFIYGEVRQGARSKDLEDAMQWLLNACMVQKVNLVQTPELPLLANMDRKSFKLYVADVGILRKLAGLAPAVVLSNQDVFGEFKGRLVENYVLQQFRAMSIEPVCYWTNPTGRAEVDFLFQNEDIVVPVEVKSGLNLAAQSLRIYRDKYSPALALRTSMSNLRLDDRLLNLPLYLLGEMPRLLAEARARVNKD